jgi:hypothetical protein
MFDLTSRDLARLTITKQHLHCRAAIADLIQVVRDVAGLHATVPTTPYLSLHARLADFTKDQLSHALYDARTLARVRCVRKTIYIHAIEDVPAFQRATSVPLVKASRRYAEGRGVGLVQYQELATEIMRLLAKHELTASEIRSALSAEADIPAVLYLMCDEGCLVRGQPVRGWRDRTYRYARFADWFPDIQLNAVAELDAITSVVRSYLAAFGPATEADAAWWTGLGKMKVRRAFRSIQSELALVTVPGVGDSLFVLNRDLDSRADTASTGEPTARLLPVLDPLLMGYRDRRRFLNEAHHPWVFDRSGNATSTVFVDGRVAGVWDFECDRTGRECVLKLLFFEEPKDTIRRHVRAEAAAVGRFIADQEVRIYECQKMPPLAQRTAGGFMSPLRDS